MLEDHLSILLFTIFLYLLYFSCCWSHLVFLSLKALGDRHQDTVNVRIQRGLLSVATDQGLDQDMVDGDGTVATDQGQPLK